MLSPIMKLQALHNFVQSKNHPLLHSPLYALSLDILLQLLMLPFLLELLKVFIVILNVSDNIIQYTVREYNIKKI